MYTKEQIMNAARRAGVSVRTAPKGRSAAFTSSDMSVYHEMDSKKFFADDTKDKFEIGEDELLTSSDITEVSFDDLNISLDTVSDFKYFNKITDELNDNNLEKDRQAYAYPFVLE